MLSHDPERVRLRLESLTSRAEASRAQGRYGDAEHSARAALTLARAAFGMQALEAAEAANELGVTLKYRGGFEEAEHLYRGALAIFKRELAADDPAIATIYHNVGGLEHARGDFAKAEPLARRSVE